MHRHAHSLLLYIIIEKTRFESTQIFEIFFSPIFSRKILTLRVLLKEHSAPPDRPRAKNTGSKCVSSAAFVRSTLLREEERPLNFTARKKTRALEF